MAPTEKVPRSPKESWNNSGSGACRLALRMLTKALRPSPRPILPDLEKFDIPTLVMHGEDDQMDDQIVPVKDAAKKSARLIKGAKEIYYAGAPHGLTATLQDQVNDDLLSFLKS
ncbi:MAG: alpha/beta hydrolase [Candidatus Nitrosocosmicus sp.]|jgi:pimeloyl-ACP methyl ester carboxylesterase|nr:alpha/beta hydrolase [Candidatus Nitrosocosmicus sp.]